MDLILVRCPRQGGNSVLEMGAESKEGQAHRLSQHCSESVIMKACGCVGLFVLPNSRQGVVFAVRGCEASAVEEEGV